MKRILITVGAALLAAVPATMGLVGNTSFAQDIPVRVPSQASVLDDHGALRSPTAAELGDDNGGQGTHAEPGDDNGGQGTHAEPGDDRSGTSAIEPGDDNGGQGTHAEPGDDKSGTSAVQSGDDKSGSSAPKASDDKSSSSNTTPIVPKVSDKGSGKGDNGGHVVDTSKSGGKDDGSGHS
jgi:hypothetical protein